MRRLRFRSWLHRLFRGHQPDYYVFPGALSGRPLIGCRACERRRNDRYWEVKRRVEGA